MIDTTKLSAEIIINLAEAEYSAEQVGHMTAEQCFEAWCSYEGLINYSYKLARILDTIRAAEVKLDIHAPLIMDQDQNSLHPKSDGVE